MLRKQIAPCRQMSSRFFSTQKETHYGQGKTMQRYNSYEEVLRTQARPQLPTEYDRPSAAPNPSEIEREHYHQFMKAALPRFNIARRTDFVLICFWAIYIFIFSLGALMHRPDDLDWIEEERQKAERAKRKMVRALRRAQGAEENELEKMEVERDIGLAVDPSSGEEKKVVVSVAANKYVGESNKYNFEAINFNELEIGD